MSTQRLTLIDATTSAAQITKAAEVATANNIGIVVPPHLIQHAKTERIATWAGYPTGAHNSLVKAAEARLAVQFGAELVAVVPQPQTLVVEDTAPLFTELIAIREAVPHPAQIAVVLDVTAYTPDQLARAAKMAAKAGIDAIVTSTKAIQNPELLKPLEGQGLPLIAVTTTALAPDFSAQEYWLTDL